MLRRWVPMILGGGKMYNCKYPCIVAVYGCNGDALRWIQVSSIQQAHRVCDWALKLKYYAAKICVNR